MYIRKMRAKIAHTEKMVLVFAEDKPVCQILFAAVRRQTEDLFAVYAYILYICCIYIQLYSLQRGVKQREKEDKEQGSFFLSLPTAHSHVFVTFAT